MSEVNVKMDLSFATKLLSTLKERDFERDIDHKYTQSDDLKAMCTNGSFSRYGSITSAAETEISRIRKEIDALYAEQAETEKAIKALEAAIKAASTE
jgi:septal ring factor EnvC (AmiA/AmiB activator)